ncbi:hypothetical protein Ahy_A02g006893 isoform B [Arachis hypogaea]|uniref:Uncharacterized protein n=1 Tax=Arachis hypogaea TaxID=3818 RepID=A0A445EAZ7_ARAHY|nr:hypothetical protein Ahy_A02g006893 isoform B [Arachis hypogaea]
MAKLFASRGAKATIITTPINEPFIFKTIEKAKTHGKGSIHIKTVEFRPVDFGLPEGCDNVDFIRSSDKIPQFFEATRFLQEPFERLLIQHNPDCVVSDMFYPWTTDSAAKFGIPRIMFHGTNFFFMCVSESTRLVLGRKAWHIGPLFLINKDDTQDKAQRRKDASIDENECLKWLDTKKPNSIVYVCFGSIANFPDSQKKSKEDGDEWLPEGFEKRMEGKGLIIRGWAPQVLILEHQAIGAFVTHCGWNSTLEAVTAGVPMVTWPIAAEQFYNEKLVTEILKIGVPIGAKKWLRLIGDTVKWEAVEKGVKKIMVGEEAEEMRNKAKVLSQLAKSAVERGGSSYSDLDALIVELASHKH